MTYKQSLRRYDRHHNTNQIQYMDGVSITFVIPRGMTDVPEPSSEELRAIEAQLNFTEEEVDYATV